MVDFVIASSVLYSMPINMTRSMILSLYVSHSALISMIHRFSMIFPFLISTLNIVVLSVNNVMWSFSFKSCEMSSTLHGMMINDSGGKSIAEWKLFGSKYRSDF